MSEQKIDIYAYDNFRLFLKDRYAAMKLTDPSCSARVFAAQAGFSNPGFLNDVIKGKRTLSLAARKKLAAAFGLTVYEAEFFFLLVKYGQEKNDGVRNDLFKKLCTRRNRSSFVKLNPALSWYYQDYRYPLVYNALMACDFTGDYDRLSDFIYPSIPAAHLKTYIEDLCAWGIVVKQKSGRFSVTQKLVEPPPSLKEQVRQLNREWILQAAAESIKLAPEKRHMSTMLLSTTPKTCKNISEKIEQVRQEIWSMIEADAEKPSCVMQLNIQYFPRSKIKEHS